MDFDNNGRLDAKDAALFDLVGSSDGKSPSGCGCMSWVLSIAVVLQILERVFEHKNTASV